MPGTDALALSEKHNVFLWLLHNKGFKKERMTQIRLDAIGTSTPLASRASFARLPRLSAWGSVTRCASALSAPFPHSSRVRHDRTSL